MKRNRYIRKAVALLVLVCMLMTACTTREPEKTETATEGNAPVPVTEPATESATEDSDYPIFTDKGGFEMDRRFKKIPRKSKQTAAEELAILQSHPVLGALQIQEEVPDFDEFDPEDINSAIPADTLGESLHFYNREEEVFPSGIRYGALSLWHQGKWVLLYNTSEEDLILQVGDQKHRIMQNVYFYCQVRVYSDGIYIAANDELKKESAVFRYRWGEGAPETIATSQMPAAFAQIAVNKSGELFALTWEVEERVTKNYQLLHWKEMDNEWIPLKRLPDAWNFLTYRSGYLMGVRQVRQDDRPERQSIQVYSIETGTHWDTHRMGDIALGGAWDPASSTMVVAGFNEQILLLQPEEETARLLSGPAVGVVERVYRLWDGFVIQTRANHFFSVRSADTPSE